jgi:hypothetical protein
MKTMITAIEMMLDDISSKNDLEEVSNLYKLISGVKINDRLLDLFSSKMKKRNDVRDSFVPLMISAMCKCNKFSKRKINAMMDVTDWESLKLILK